MEIRQLNSTDVVRIAKLFDVPKQMGVDSNEFNLIVKNNVSTLFYDIFCNSFLSGLENYKAFGAIENDEVTSLVATYDSPDAAEWYITQVRSQNSTNIRHVIDAAILHYENLNKFKFYSLSNTDTGRSYRRFLFSKDVNERYDTVDEFIVPAKTRCIYTNAWHILFNRVLVPKDSTVKLSYLKPEFRKGPGLAGNI
jgi:hypothetical protein